MPQSSYLHNGSICNSHPSCMCSTHRDKEPTSPAFECPAAARWTVYVEVLWAVVAPRLAMLAVKEGAQATGGWQAVPAPGHCLEALSWDSAEAWT